MPENGDREKAIWISSSQDLRDRLSSVTEPIVYTKAERDRSRKDMGKLHRDASCAREWLAANDAYLESCDALDQGCSCVAFRPDCPSMNALGPGPIMEHG